MVSQKKATKKGGMQKGKSQKKARPARPRVEPERIHRYLQLLADPCAGDISAQPPYFGIDGGYALRTTDYFSVDCIGYAGLTIGNTYRADFAVSVTPSAGGSVGVSIAAANSGTVLTTSHQLVASFIRNAAIVKHYRPKACCLKYIPTGSANTRQGLISRGYTTGQAWQTGATFPVSQVVPLAQATDTISTVKHEVKWLPTEQDGLWADNDDFDNSQYNGGCVFVVGQGIDATAVSATDCLTNGQFEVTIVWEWQPATGNGVTTAFTTPTPATLNTVLSRIGDVASFVMGGVKNAAGAASRVMNAFDMMSSNATRGPSLLTYY
jgi:hypothetical protein